MTRLAPGKKRLGAFLVGAHLAWIGAWAIAGHGSIWLPMGIVAGVVAVLAIIVDRPHTLQLLRPRPRSILLGIVAGIALALGSHLLYPFFSAASPELPHQVQALYARLWLGPGPVLALSVFVLIITTEELVWRGSLQSLVEEAFAKPKTDGPHPAARTLGHRSLFAAATASTLPYALAQAGQGTLLLVVIAAAVGFVFSLLRALSQDLWAPLLCHLVWDIAIMIVWPLEPITSV